MGLFFGFDCRMTVSEAKAESDLCSVKGKVINLFREILAPAPVGLAA